MHVSIDPRKAEALRTAFDMSESFIRRIFREFPELTESPDLIPKLEYLTKNFTRNDWQQKPCDSLADCVALTICGFWRLTYDELLLCASVPDRMGFTEGEREKYNSMVLNWGYLEDPRVLRPLLTQLCDEEHADKIIKELCFPGPFVGCDTIQIICERLLSYPVRIDPAWFGNYWFLLFSYYADPCRVLDELDRRFQPEHVMEVFVSNDEWSRIGYGLNGGLVGEMRLYPRYADEMFEKAERRFAAYRL